LFTLGTTEVDLDLLNSYEARNLIKGSRRDGFTVWCYTQEAVYTRAWDDVTLACRGLITGPSGELVARPFRKFFNHGEPEAALEDGPFYAFDKMDGTLIVVGNYNDDAVVSTKGSFDTWHSEAARKLLLGFVPPAGQTALFELIHPDNRIVIDYDGYEGLVLLGLIDNETGADVGLPEEGLDIGWHGDIVVRRNFNLKSMIETIKRPEAGAGREGFVVVWPKSGQPWNRVKLKFESYIQLHGIYTGLTNRRVWEFLMSDSLDALIDMAPDELHDAITKCADDLMSAAEELEEEALRIASEARLGFTTRKEAAEFILSKTKRPVTGLTFKAYDGKSIRTEALRLVYPEASKFVGSAGLN
jgi:RNA ligase